MECLILPPLQALRRPKIASDSSKMVPRRPKDGLLAPQDGPKTAPRQPQDVAWGAPGAPPGPLWKHQDAPSAPTGPHDAPRLQFWTLRTSILEPQNLDFGASEPQFWIYNI